VEKQRADLVSSISHELRTPLTAVVGFLDVINDDGSPVPDAERRELSNPSEDLDRTGPLYQAQALAPHYEPPNDQPDDAREPDPLGGQRRQENDHGENEEDAGRGTEGDGCS